ncbi:hypothetical protein E2C01_051569 [Portunus trituberculatus]|uniref:Uncharacterized protein n=1 Tax=Portunus trituberculatus TaxID=210409 RepID=A0A5B7GJX6_PORTR|nr:hypothetical protein [Portunus trituberculatus]
MSGLRSKIVPSLPVLLSSMNRQLKPFNRLSKNQRVTSYRFTNQRDRHDLPSTSQNLRPPIHIPEAINLRTREEVELSMVRNNPKLLISHISTSNPTPRKMLLLPNIRTDLELTTWKDNKIDNDCMALVNEYVNKGAIIQSNRLMCHTSWVFTIPKTSGGLRLVFNLRSVNNNINPMEQVAESIFLPPNVDARPTSTSDPELQGNAGPHLGSSLFISTPNSTSVLGNGLTTSPPSP